MKKKKKKTEEKQNIQQNKKTAKYTWLWLANDCTKSTMPIKSSPNKMKSIEQKMSENN